MSSADITRATPRGGKRPSPRLSRRKLLASLAVSPLLLTGCQSLPNLPFLATPTPTGPRPLRIGVLDYPEGYAASQSSVFRLLDTHVKAERHVETTLVPIAATNTSWQEAPRALSQALKDLPEKDVPDLVLPTAVGALATLAKDQQIRDLGPLLRRESWFKPDDYNGNVLVAGQVHGNQVALPLDLNIEALFYNRPVFEEQGVQPPKPGWTWDQFLLSAKQLTRSREAGAGGRWGAYVIPNIPRIWTLAWEWEAKFIDEAGDRIDLAEPGTLQAMQFQADLIHVHKVAPPLDRQALQNANVYVPRMLQAIYYGQTAMLPYTANREAWWKSGPTKDAVLAAELPVARYQVASGFPSLLLGIPARAPDLAHSLNGVRALGEASAESILFPGRKPTVGLGQIQPLLADSEVERLTRTLEVVRCLPGDSPLNDYELGTLLVYEYAVPILVGEKTPSEAAQNVQPRVNQRLAEIARAG